MTKVITGRVRFSYVNVFEPSAIGEGTPKYNVSILIDKSDTETLQKIETAISEAMTTGADKVMKNGKPYPNLKMPLRDGDVEREDDEAYAGMYFVNASSLRKPQVVDKDLNPIISKDEFYSGCYGRASISFYAFNAEGNRGIACGLNNLQKQEDGENLAGSTSAVEDFGDELS